mgnify:FL=1
MSNSAATGHSRIVPLEDTLESVVVPVGGLQAEKDADSDNKQLDTDRSPVAMPEARRQASKEPLLVAGCLRIHAAELLAGWRASEA